MIPQVPRKTKTIPRQSEARLRAWIAHLSNLSTRIRVKLPNEKGFDSFLLSIQNWIRMTKHLMEGDTILDFPKAENIAFVVCLDSSSTQDTKYLYQDVRIFCFGDVAFQPGYFEWEGETITGRNNTYSLYSFSGKVLSWGYITKLLVTRIQELEKVVPPPPC